MNSRRILTVFVSKLYYQENMTVNLFVKVDKEMTAAGKTPVAWNFSSMPSENWKNGVGSALTAYAAGTGSWDDVVTAFVDGWASEAALNAAA